MGLVLAGVVMFLALMFSVWALVKMHTPVVQAAGVPFLLVITLRCSILASSLLGDVVSWLVQWYLTASWWWFSGIMTWIGHCLYCCTMDNFYLFHFSIFSIICENIAIVSAEKLCRHQKRGGVHPYYILPSVGILNWILLVTLTSPLHWERTTLHVYDEYNQCLEMYGTCMSDQFDGIHHSVVYMEWPLPWL